MTPRAWLAEVFSSWQGEGLWLGCRQIFLRFCECNLRCSYCDTSFSWRRPEAARFGSETLPNPLTPADLFPILEKLDLSLHHSVSFTGGEPLLWSEFLLPLAGGIRERGGRTYLETNGTLPDALGPLLSSLDFISMDWKLPWSLKEDLCRIHKEFLRLSLGKAIQVKTVCSDRTTREEVAAMASAIAALDKNIPLVLQPEGNLGVSWSHLAALEEICTRYLNEIRVIPQLHKLLNLP